MILAIILIVAGVLANGALLWLIVYALTPAETNSSLWRGLRTGAVLSASLYVCQWLIEPKIGDNWSTVVQLAVTPIIIKLGFRLSVFRSILVSLVLWIVAGLTMYFLLIRPDSSSNGLDYLVSRFRTEAIAAHIELQKGERSELAELAANIL